LTDGLSGLELVRRAKEIGSVGLAITDHGNLHGLPFFLEECQKHNIKLIPGIEFYYVPDDDIKKYREDYHLLVLAKNDDGLKNIFRLIEFSYVHGFYYHPRINRKKLLEYSDGLIVTTGCVQSYINQKICNGEIETAYKEFVLLLEHFKEDFYVEIQDHGLSKQTLVNKQLLEWADKHKVKIIATNDSHYTNKEDAYVHDILLAIQTGKTIHDADRLRFTDDSNRLLDEFYMKSADEMKAKKIFFERPEAIKNTYEVVEKVNYSYTTKSDKYLFPSIVLDENPDDYVKKYCFNKLSELSLDFPIYRHRLEHELDIIKRMGFSSYFITVMDIVNTAKSNDILVGPGRGSAAGSLVAYLMGITSIDPIKYGLLFERFLNPDRVSPPDIDLDFEDLKRDYIIKAIKNKYGDDNVCNIVTLSRIGAKMAIRDVFRVYGISKKETDQVIGALPEKNDLSFEDIDNMLPENKDILMKKLDTKQKLEAFNIARHLENKPRQASVHASGVIVSPKPIIDIMPISVINSNNNRTKVTHYDMRYCEKMGLMKIDILGLKTLTALRRIIEQIHKRYNIKIDIYSMDTNDGKTWDIFKSGLTKGIFQFESDGMREALKKVQPDNINDLIALNALYRPGPIKQIDVYAKRKHGEEEVSYIDNRLSSILDETYGIIVYQEQIMKIVQVIAGYSLAQADLLRRAIGKKDAALLQSNKEKFIEGAIKNNTSKEVAEQLFSLIEEFADYGFNKSHAAAYSYVAYVTAFMKAHYPIYFYSAFLETYKDDIEYMNELITEAKLFDIEVEPPCVVNSEVEFSVKNDKIYFGLSAIKNLSEKTAQSIVANRGEGAYDSLEDIINKNNTALNARDIKALIASTSLRNIPKIPPAEVLLHPHNIQQVITYKDGLFSSKQQNSLFGNFFDNITIDTSKKIDKIELITYTREYLGFSLDKIDYRPIEQALLKNNINIMFLKTIKEVIESSNNKMVAAFVLDGIKEKVSKKGNKYYSVSVYDGEEIRELYGDYEQLSRNIKNNTLYLFLLEKPKNSDLIIVRSIINIDDIENIKDKILEYAHKPNKKENTAINEFINTENENTRIKENKYDELTNSIRNHDNKTTTESSTTEVKNNKVLACDFSKIYFMPLCMKDMLLNDKDEQALLRAISTSFPLRHIFGGKHSLYEDFIQVCISILKDESHLYNVSQIEFIRYRFYECVASYLMMGGRLDKNIFLEFNNLYDKCIFF
jgi:DNA polymerase-3 subunit alpha